MQLGNYTPPEKTEGDSYKPSENAGHVLIVKVNDHKHIDSTAYNSAGGPGVILDVCDLDQGGKVFRDILWMNGALVDGLKNYVGQTIVIKLAWTKSAKSGREYVSIVPANDEDMRRAQARVDQGDPFAPTLTTPQPTPGSAAPF